MPPAESLARAITARGVERSCSAQVLLCSRTYSQGGHDAFTYIMLLFEGWRAFGGMKEQYVRQQYAVL